MSKNRDVSAEVDSEIDLRRSFENIRQDGCRAESGPALAELYRRAGYLMTLTYPPPWGKKSDERGENLRRVAESEFQETARKINHRAAQLGTEADYHDTWETCMSTSATSRHGPAQARYNGSFAAIHTPSLAAQPTPRR